MRSRRRGGLRLAAVDGSVEASRFYSGPGVGNYASVYFGDGLPNEDILFML